MTGRFIVALAIIAAALAGVVYWLGRPGAPGPELENILPCSPREVTELSVRWSEDGAAWARLSRSADGTWVMRWRSGGSEGTWPVIGARVSGAIGLLAKVRGTTEAQADTTGEPVWITVGTVSGPVELSASKRAFGGTGVVSRTDGHGSVVAGQVDGQLVQVFQRADVLAWRDFALFPSDLSRSSRVWIDDGESVTAIHRVGGRWGLLVPAPARADSAAVEGFLAGMKKLRIARFQADQPGWSGVSEDEFARSIVVESDRTTPEAGPDGRWVIRQELRIGPFAGDQSLIAIAGVTLVRPATRTRGEEIEDLWGPTVVVVDRVTAEDLLRRAEVFLARTATGMIQADVRGIEIETVSSGSESSGAVFTARREIDRWVVPGGSSLGLVEREALRQVIERLTERPATSCTFAPDGAASMAGVGEGPRAGWRVRLYGPDGPAVEDVMVLAVSGEPSAGADVPRGPSGADGLVIVNGRVGHRHDGDARREWVSSMEALGIR